MYGFVFTVGHSTLSRERLIALLTAHGVTAVADVRSRPYSRFNDQFNQDALRSALKQAGLAYVFLGRELGGRPDDPQCYLDGKVQYDRLASTPLFRQGLARLTEGALSHRIALLCAEKDPLNCHRAILVCRHLAAQGITAQHILPDGQLESHEDALSRLLNELGLSDHDLFRDRAQLVAEAYARRGAEIAYRLSQSSLADV